MASSQLEQKQKTPLMVFFVAIFLFESIHIYAQKQKSPVAQDFFDSRGACLWQAPSLLSIILKFSCKSSPFL